MTKQDYQIIFHEIKNNIAFINSSLQLVEKAHPEIKEYPYWKDSMQELSSLKKMLISLSSARLDDNLDLQEISVTHFLAEVSNSCSVFFNSGRFYCQTESKPSLPKLSIDSDRLKRAFYNLIKNSYEAMNGCGCIRFHACQENSFVRIDLIDHGGGINPEHLSKLFTPFHTTKQSGSGLGLMIAKQIIEAHDGHLSIDSRPGDGCTFSIYLPCRID